MKTVFLAFFIAFGLSTTAQSNYALSFNGTSNYVDCGNSSSLDANAIRTMECWVKFNSLTGSQEILSKSIVGQGIELLLFGGNLSAYFMRDGINTSFIAYPASNLRTNLWYHVAVTWDGTKESIRLYVDGVSVGTRTDGGNINTTGLTNPAGDFRIGNWADPAPRYLNGTVDEVRIWNVNRTAEQIKSAMFTINPNQTGLVAYYKMDQGNGTSVTNSATTTAVTGTLTGSPLPAWVASPVIKSTNAIALDGSNDYINLGISSSLKFSSNFTVELKVKSANWAVGVQQQLISCFESGGYGLTLTTDGNINFFLRSNVTGTAYLGVSYPVSHLTNDTWYHVAGTFDGRYMRMYIDGSLIGTYDLGSTGNVFYSFPANPVFVGADPNSDQTPQGLYFSGEIDEVRLWNVVRTQTQIQAAMNTEIAPLDPTQSSGLVSYYTFNQGIASGTNTNLATVIDQKGGNNAILTNLALTGSTSNYVAQQSTLIALPVTYLSFTAQNLGGQVRLQWRTAQEQNTSHFVVQQSVDNNTWNNVGNVPAAGNSSEVRNYSFTHSTPANGLNLYRLMQVDRDGKSSYSRIAGVNLNRSETTNVLYNYVNNNRIEVQLAKAAVIALYSYDGKLLMRQQFAAGRHTIDASGFAKGIYLLRSGNQTEKIMLQ